MANISKKNKELYDLGEGDNLIEFDLVNPTTSDAPYNLFNTTTLSLVPTVANPVVPPSVISSTIPVGNTPQGIAFNPKSNTMYVCNNGSLSVSVINCNTNSVSSTIPLPIAFPNQIAYCSSNNTMYVSTLSQNVIVIDCSTNTVIATIPNAANRQLAYNTKSNTMYSCNSVLGYVSVIDCNTNTFTTVIIPQASQIAYNSLNNLMYVCTGLSGAIQIIDCTTNTLLPFISIAGTSNYLAYNSLSNTLYVANFFFAAIFVIDCNTNNIIPPILGIPSLGLGSYLTYASQTNNIYYSDSALNINVINCETNTIINTIAEASVIDGISYNFLSNVIYNTNQSNDVSVISPAIPQVPYITGSFNYNEFIQDVINNPVCVERLILVSQQNTTNFNQVINVVYKDANGIETQNPFIPSLSVGTSQFQSGIGKVDFLDECLVLGVNQYFSNFTNYALSTVKVLLIYKQLEKSKLLTNKKGMCGKLEFKCNPLQTFNPTKDDAAFDYFHIIPIKPTKPTIRPFSIKDIVPIKDVVPVKPIRDVKTDVKTDVKPDVRTDVKTDIKTDDTKPSIKPLRVSNMYGGQKDITCGACEWSWNRNESDADDVYVCHKCGYDNQKIYQNEKFRV